MDCWVDDRSIYIREWFRTTELRPSNILSIKDQKQIMTTITIKNGQGKKHSRLVLNAYENVSEVLLKIKNNH